MSFGRTMPKPFLLKPKPKVLLPRHILSTEQFTDRALIEAIFDRACTLGRWERSRQYLRYQTLKGRILATFFYEPSTRTQSSFEAAMQRLGGTVISTKNAGKYSSVIKGESLVDSVKTIGQYADIVALRHPEEGSAKMAAEVCPVPLINAGDGQGEHVTQALLDVCSIWKGRGSIDDFTIAFMGDPEHSRTIHSLIKLLPVCRNVRVFIVSSSELVLPKEYKDYLTEKKIEWREYDSPKDILSEVDVWYLTRLQLERFGGPGIWNFIVNRIRLWKAMRKQIWLSVEDVSHMKEDAIILDPFPRGKKASREIDKDPRAMYFFQMKMGLYVRMALLQMMFE